MSVLGAIAGLSGFGLAGTAFGFGINAARGEAEALAAATGRSVSDAMAALAAAKGGEGGSRAGGGFQGGGAGGAQVPAEMTNASPAAATPAAAGRPTISPNTRANAAARAGGGISPDFLSVLEQMRGAA
jgi:hypothetical protein